VLAPGDLADPAHCRAVIQRAVDELGGLDILVNNARFQRTYDSIDEIPDEEWDYTFRTNITAMFDLCKAAVPHMKPGSSIINVTSIQSDKPNPMLLAYAATKGRHLQLHRRAGADAGRKGHPRERGGARARSGRR
jgi:NAD(P)-dependent dehydrogenase (short-subunit alcohol dehydrogenase family)